MSLAAVNIHLQDNVSKHTIENYLPSMPILSTLRLHTEKATDAHGAGGEHATEKNTGKYQKQFMVHHTTVYLSAMLFAVEDTLRLGLIAHQSVQEIAVMVERVLLLMYVDVPQGGQDQFVRQRYAILLA